MEVSWWIMKDRTIKILLIISIIIIIIGLILGFPLVDYFGNTIINNSDRFTSLLGILGLVALRLIIIIVTFGIVIAIWLVYVIIILLCKVKSKIENKKLKIGKKNDMELIEIVDENGNFTGQIMDKEEAHDKNLLHNEVGIFIINDDGKVLLQKRSANKRFSPNKWGLCAGHVEANESLENAALREIKEEVGLDITSKELIPYGEREITISDSNSHITYFYYIRCNKKENEFAIQTEELSEVKWFNIDEIITMIKEGKTSFKENRIKMFEKIKSDF